MSKYLPTWVSLSVFDIDYDTLYAKGKRIILFDLDNTLISYFESVASIRLATLGKKLLDMGFKTYVLTNNHGSRIEKFMKSFPATLYGSHMQKPFAYKIKSFLKTQEIYDYSQIVMIGDQLVTDIKCANRLKVDSVLIKSISRESEHFYTRINRLREKSIVKKIAKKDASKAALIWQVVSKEKK